MPVSPAEIGQRGNPADICMPDYRNCLVNLSSSIMRYFGAEPSHETLPLADRLLTGNYRNVILILLDGLGLKMLENNLKPDGFLASHLAGDYLSVFPPTTVAATTGLLSGLYPCESGWLGWDCYIPSIDRNVTMFRNVDADTGESLRGEGAGEDTAHRYYPYQSIFDRIREAGGLAYAASPFMELCIPTLEGNLERAAALCRQPGKKFIYVYDSEPDHTMHNCGCGSAEASQITALQEQKVEEFCRTLRDTELADSENESEDGGDENNGGTLVLITADHGHIDTGGAALSAHPEIEKCLVRKPAIEPRAKSFFVKEGMEADFEKAFLEAFGQDYLLYKKEEVLEMGLFGPLQSSLEHPDFRRMIGDYLALARKNLSFYNTEAEAERFLSHHAGITADEMRIPLIAFRSRG
ncbi:MAG: phosphodiesterase [Lachnospiraceae bacterium]|nr:phosphodiesterase [Lachnospiraceae bacterium]